VLFRSVKLMLSVLRNLCIYNVFVMGLLFPTSSQALEYSLTVISHPSKPLISQIDNSSSFSLIFNPTWVQASPLTQNVEGLLMRTQDCPIAAGDPCAFCGGSQALASVLTFSPLQSDGTFAAVEDTSVVFGPADESDSWGTEDPRMVYDAQSGVYYMFYTAYNGHDIYLSLATSTNPTKADSWTRHGAVFPNGSVPNSKSGALLLREEGPHFLYWGDSSIRIAESSDPTVWPSEGDVFIETRADHFDSKLVESGPPPLLLSTGDFLFFYNSASLGWPDAEGSAYHPGWVILDGQNPRVIKQRSEEPLLTPEFAYELGVSPYTCNVPNVIFLEAARPLGNDVFEVYYGGADAAIGSATIQVFVK